MNKKWQDDHENRLNQVQKEYDNCMKSVGTAHAEARQQVSYNYFYLNIFFKKILLLGLVDRCNK